MPGLFLRIIHQQAQVSSLKTFYSKPESLTIVLLSKYIEKQPSYPWYSPECCWKMLSLSDLVTTKPPQSRYCPILPVAYQFSHRAIKESNYEAASEPLLPNIARRIPILSSRYKGKCAARVFEALWGI